PAAPGCGRAPGCLPWTTRPHRPLAPRGGAMSSTPAPTSTPGPGEPAPPRPASDPDTLPSTPGPPPATSPAPGTEPATDPAAPPDGSPDPDTPPTTPGPPPGSPADPNRSEEHTSELQSRENLVCRLLLEKTKD